LQARSAARIMGLLTLYWVEGFEGADMDGNDRRVSTRKPLPISVYLIVDGVRHPGQLRDLSMAGAGFSDPVLAVRLKLELEQDVILEIPADDASEEVLRLPGVVAHSSSGLRPRLGIKFQQMAPEIASRLVLRLGRASAGSESRTSGVRSSVRDSGAELHFVAVESGHKESKTLARFSSVLIGAVVIGLFILMLVLLSRITI